MMTIKSTYTGTKGIEDIFKTKSELRKKQANLPIEEKIKILVRLQRIAYEAALSRGITPLKRPWAIDIE
jgi:hypothetical protein